MQGERVKKYANIHEKMEHLDVNLEDFKDIINHGKGTKTCELQYTINRVLGTFLGASNTFIFMESVHLIKWDTIS